MSYVTNVLGGYIAETSFDGNDTITVQQPSVYVTLSGVNQEFDSVYLTITDADGSTEVVTDISNTEDFIYYPTDDLDVTGYPAGNITLDWSMTVSGVDLTHQQIVEYSDPVPVNVTSASVASKTNNQVHLDSAHAFNILLEDSVGNVVDCYAARVVFYDTNTSSIIETQEASLSAVGSGLWSKTHTLASATYNAELRRYQHYWEVKINSGSSWTKIDNSLEWLDVYPIISDVQAGSLGYCTIQDLRTAFPFIDDHLDQFVLQQSERDIVLQQLISNVSEEIHEKVQGTKAQGKVDLLKQWCVIQCAVDLLTTYAPAYGRFADTNLQIKHLKQKLFRVKQTLLGRNRQLLIRGV